jgi:hypothetical protein
VCRAPLDMLWCVAVVIDESSQRLTGLDAGCGCKKRARRSPCKGLGARFIGIP